MNNTRMDKLAKCIVPIVLILLCLFFCIFYINIHPICLLDTDDYGYSYYHRSAIPMVGKWNPAKVLPETMFGFVSEFGTFVIYPLLGDLFKAETISYALVVS